MWTFLEAVKAWLAQLQFGGLIDTVIVVLASLLCITFHEISHGFVAWKLGDPTAKEAGRLTINPLRHVDLFGLIMMAVFHFGWAKAVPVNVNRLRRPRRDMALVALAGPVSNLLMGFVALILRAVLLYLILFHWGEAAWSGYVITFLEYVAILSVGLAVFNVIPVPPLDGSKVLFSLLPEESYRKLLRYERYGMILLMVLLWTDVLDVPLSMARGWVMDLLSSAAWKPFEWLTGI